MRLNLQIHTIFFVLIMTLLLMMYSILFRLGESDATSEKLVKNTFLVKQKVCILSEQP